MKYPPHTEARVVLIDGPVSIFLHEAPSHEILDAYNNLGKLVRVAAEQLGAAHTFARFDEQRVRDSFSNCAQLHAGGPVPLTPDDCGGVPE